MEAVFAADRIEANGARGDVYGWEHKEAVIAKFTIGPSFEETTKLGPLVSAAQRDRVLGFTPGHLIHGEDVAQLQQRLLELGFTLDKVDGVFGRITDAAVREFQRNVGLASDGIAGPEVFSALARLVRTVVGGNQEHLRELASWDAGARTAALDSASIMIDPSDDPQPLVTGGMTQAQVCWDIANRLEGRLLAAGSLVVMSRGGSMVVDKQRLAFIRHAAARFEPSPGRPRPPRRGAAQRVVGLKQSMQKGMESSLTTVEHSVPN